MANDTKPAQENDQALAKAETALQTEADRRMRDVKAEADTDAKAASEAKKPANPDG